MAPRPQLFTFDIFGTVIDWRTGLVAAARRHGVRVDDRKFDQVIDWQARAEAGPFRPYTALLAESLVQVLRMRPGDAASIAQEVGHWPLFPDAADGLRALMSIAPCVAMTNSDQAHGRQAQDAWGFRLSGWICAEDVRTYKPSPAFWMAVAARREVELGPHWWHVSAYADYDLEAAARLGLTTVFIERPHSRWGPSTLAAPDLRALAASVRF